MWYNWIWIITSLFQQLKFASTNFLCNYSCGTKKEKEKKKPFIYYISRKLSWYVLAEIVSCSILILQLINLSTCKWPKRTDAIYMHSPNKGLYNVNCNIKITMTCKTISFIFSNLSNWICFVVPVYVCKWKQCTIYKNRQRYFEVPVDQSACRFLLCIIFRQFVKCVSLLFICSIDISFFFFQSSLVL